MFASNANDRVTESDEQSGSPKNALASVRLNCGADMAPTAGKKTLCFRIHFSTYDARARKVRLMLQGLGQLCLP